MLKGIALASGVLLSGFERLGWPAMASATAAVQQGSSGGRQLGLVEFTGEPRIEMDTVNGAELNCRLFTDLSTLTPRKSDQSRPKTSTFVPESRSSWKTASHGPSSSAAWWKNR